ncbi:MAG: protein-L-isoaspartate O-methyltransferase [Gammaproteobacteria bacterium]|nr:protein-L-isoaspartate O-methyltransferase [Gammaproteobacteria bacterium]
MIANNLEIARINMVKQQMRTWEVLDQKVLDLVASTPREEFVPDAYRELAFADTEISIGHGQRMMAPKLEARILQALDIQPEDVILEIGTGSGYLTACMARLGARVTSLDIHPEFTTRAGEILKNQGIDNVNLITANGLTEQQGGGPFDVIAVTGSLPRINEKLKRQLTMGGRLFAVAGDHPAMEAILITRVGDYQWREEAIFETDLGRLDNLKPDSSFIF